MAPSPEREESAGSVSVELELGGKIGGWDGKWVEYG